MLKYVNTMVTFSEVPDEISLCIEISNCPCHCKNCHSPYLAEDIGKPLIYKDTHNNRTVINCNPLSELIEANNGITCVCLMGGDSNPEYINILGKVIKHHHLKSAWYSGRQELSKDIELRNFDAIKLGGYNEALGPLNYPTTNQKFYKIINGEMYDYTYLFWKDSKVEVWRDIDGFDGYQVSNLGNVRSLNYNGTGNTQVLKPSLSGRNRTYLSINMQVADKVIRRNIHRLVAMAFIPNPDNLPEVNHIDEDGTNNKINNLEWCNRKYNLNYGNRTQKFIDSKSIPILQLNLDGTLVKEWKSQVEICNQLKIDSGSLSHCLHGYRIKKGKKYPVYSYHGYKWRYKE